MNARRSFPAAPATVLRLKTGCLFAVSFFVGLFVLQSMPVVRADTPAVTDFGQVDIAPTVTSVPSAWKQAMFVTLYPDGWSQSEVRGVTDDAENTLLGPHPSWQLDRRLTWFVQMPVYVRELSSHEAFASRHSV